jgi:transposase
MSGLSVAGLIAEIGPAGMYHSAKALVKLAGTNPIQSESAEKGRRHTPVSKKGRSELRCCLWQAAVSFLRVNQEYKAWAKGLQERGASENPLHRREALGRR